jgi:hypothetical protein
VDAEIMTAVLLLMLVAGAPDPPPAAPAGETIAPAPQDKRVFGVLPNYRAADANAPFVPITARRKFYIGMKDSTDYPVFFTGAFFAGLSQWQNSNPTYGQGARGFGKRYAAGIADVSLGNIMTESLFPVLLREDPRYFRLGHGSTGTRVRYALSRILVTRTDAGRSRCNFSELLGNATMVAISTSYSPAARSAPDAATRLGMQLATDALGGLLKEFWPDIKKRKKTAN